MRVVIHMVHALGFMRFEREVSLAGSEIPDLHRAIQAGRRKRIRVFGIDGYPHHVMAVPFKHLHALPAFLPVPQLDCHVIGGSQDERLRRVDSDRSDIIGVRLELRNLLRRIIVVHSQLEVIGPADNPVLASNETTGPNGDVR